MKSQTRWKSLNVISKIEDAGLEVISAKRKDLGLIFRGKMGRSHWGFKWNINESGLKYQMVKWKCTEECGNTREWNILWIIIIVYFIQIQNFGGQLFPEHHKQNFFTSFIKFVYKIFDTIIIIIQIQNGGGHLFSEHHKQTFLLLLLNLWHKI